MNVVQKEDRKSTLLQGAGTLDYQNASHEKPSLQINRRRMLAQPPFLDAPAGTLAHGGKRDRGFPPLLEVDYPAQKVWLST